MPADTAATGSGAGGRIRTDTGFEARKFRFMVAPEGFGNNGGC